MCPFAVDDARLRDTIPGQTRGANEMPLLSLDPHKPPVKSIPHGEFPRVVYKHPREPFKVIEHRNAKRELVDEEIVPTEHLTRVIACQEHEGTTAPVVKCEKCKAALKQALAEGWVLEPYIAPPLPDRNANLYDAPAKNTD